MGYDYGPRNIPQGDLCKLLLQDEEQINPICSIAVDICEDLDLWCYPYHKYVSKMVTVLLENPSALDEHSATNWMIQKSTGCGYEAAKRMKHLRVIPVVKKALEDFFEPAP